MSERPDTVVETNARAHTMTASDARDWFETQAAAAGARGVTWSRFTVREGRDTFAEALLYEGWAERPVDEGAPRWSVRG